MQSSSLRQMGLARRIDIDLSAENDVMNGHGKHARVFFIVPPNNSQKVRRRTSHSMRSRPS